METQASIQSQERERQLIGIVRRLPPERVSQLIDFARFLELQSSEGYEERSKEVETERDILASEEEWDELFARPEARRVMRQMAREALEDYRSGRTTEIAITEDGRLRPA